MSISVAEIRTFCNANLGRNEVATGYDVHIQQVLDDLAGKNLLNSEDTTQSLADGDTDLDYPDLYKQLVSIVLNDGTCDKAPLKLLPGGYKHYLRLMENYSSGLNGTPRWYAEFDDKFWPYPVPGQAFTATIKFFKYHAQSVAAIEFGDEFRNAIYWGTAYFYALGKPLSRYAKTYGPMYEREKLLQKLRRPSQPSIVRG